jgi:hypothetical protein
MMQRITALNDLLKTTDTDIKNAITAGETDIVPQLRASKSSIMKQLKVLGGVDPTADTSVNNPGWGGLQTTTTKKP